MFEIKYKFYENKTLNIKKANEVQLRYNLFLGDLVLKNESRSIIIDWNWIPILDFTLSLLVIINIFLKKAISREEFNFTESEEKIIFHKFDSKIQITCSFSDQSIETNIEDFRNSINIFCKAVFLDIISREPKIKYNDIFSRYLKEFDEYSLKNRKR